MPLRLRLPAPEENVKLSCSQGVHATLTATRNGSRHQNLAAQYKRNCHCYAIQKFVAKASTDVTWEPCRV